MVCALREIAFGTTAIFINARIIQQSFKSLIDPRCIFRKVSNVNTDVIALKERIRFTIGRNFFDALKFGGCHIQDFIIVQIGNTKIIALPTRL